MSVLQTIISAYVHGVSIRDISELTPCCSEIGSINDTANIATLVVTPISDETS